MSSGISVSLIFHLDEHIGWIWLAGISLSLGDQPGNDICNFLRGHRPVRHIIAPIWMTKVGTPGNDGCAQSLIAHERKKGIIDNGTSFFRAFPFRSVTSSAERGVTGGAADGVAGFRCGIRRRARQFHLCPMRAHLTHQYFDLLVSQHPTRTFCKRRHKRTMDTGGYNATNRVVIGNRPINRIGQSERWAAFSILTMAACAVLLVKSCKVAHFVGFEFHICLGWLAWWPATRKQKR